MREVDGLNPVVYEMRLDVARGGSQACVILKRNDERVRALRIRLYAGSTPAALSGDEIAVLRGVKADGTALYSDCSVVGNAIECLAPGQMLAVPGQVECELVVYGGDGSVLTTPRFDVYVEETLYGDSRIESTDEYSGLTSAMTQVAAMRGTLDGLYGEMREAYESGALIGPTGPAGPQGEPGEQGIRGEAGEQGPRGETGEQGQRGDKGDPGDPGERGPQGEQGPSGTSFTVLGLYATYGELVSAHPAGAAGAAYAVGSAGENCVYLWDTDQNGWMDIGKLQGPKGDRGEQGIQGDAGGQGPQGEKGAKGDTGPKGDAGEQGPQGEKGVKGDAGPKGDAGEKGMKGDKGEVGEKGAKGEKGDTGNAGAKGDAGSAGPGVAAGGAVGNVLKKAGAGDYETGWGTLGASDVGALPLAGGTLSGTLVAGNPAVNAQAVRNTYGGTGDLEAGTSQLATGVIYFAYE